MKEVLEGFRKVCWCSRWGEGEIRVVGEVGWVGSIAGAPWKAILAGWGVGLGSQGLHPHPGSGSPALLGFSSVGLTPVFCRRQNEEVLKKCAQEYLSRVKKEEQRYQALKVHAEEKLDR